MTLVALVTGAAFTARAEASAWLYARTGDVEILTDVGAPAAQDLVETFARLQFGLRQFMPAALLPPDTATTVIVCRVDDEVAGLAANGSPRGFHAQNGDQAVVLLPGGLDGAVHDEAKIRFLELATNRLTPAPPLWFALGFKEVLGRAEFHPDAIEVRRIPSATLRLHARSGRFLPFAQLLALTRRSPEYASFHLEPARQATAWVHLALTHANDRWRQGLFALAQRNEPATPDERWLRQQFSHGIDELDTMIRDHVESPPAGRTFALRAAMPPLPPDAVRPATPAEVSRIKSDALRLAGRMEEARAELLRGLAREPREPRLLASLGLLELEQGHATKAEQLLQQAVEQEVDFSGAYLALARLHLERARGRGPSERRLSATETHRILQLLFAANARPPLRADVFTTIAEVWLQSAVPPTPAHLAALETGVSLFPRDAQLLYQTAYLKWKYGASADAAKLVSKGLRVAEDAGTIARLERLQASLLHQPTAMR